MAESKYIEGNEALENFERGMRAIFQVPKKKIEQRKKQQQRRKALLFFVCVKYIHAKTIYAFMTLTPTNSRSKSSPNGTSSFLI